MIYLHKILPLFFSPVTIIIVLALFGLMLKKYQLVYMSIALLILGSNPILSKFLLKYVEGNQVRISIDEVMPSEAIVVLGGMLTSVQSTQGIEFEWIDPDRFFGGLELLKANKAPYLIFSDGKFPWEKNLTTEGIFLQQKAVSYGLDENRILITKSAQNTDDEAMALQELLEEKLGSHSKNIILVTSAFHMERAKALFNQKGFMVTAYPVDFKVDSSDLTPMSFMPSAYALKDVEFCLRELIGRFYYSALHFLQQLQNR